MSQPEQLNDDGSVKEAAKPGITQKEANIRLSKIDRFLNDYKIDFLNGKPPYDVSEFKSKLVKIVNGKTVIVPVPPIKVDRVVDPAAPSPTKMERVGSAIKNTATAIAESRIVGTASNSVAHPIIATKEAVALTKEGLAGKGWSLNTRQEAKNAAEALTAGSKNDPFRID